MKKHTINKIMQNYSRSNYKRNRTVERVKNRIGNNMGGHGSGGEGEGVGVWLGDECLARDRTGS